MRHSPTPDKNSKRSQKRKNRGFVSLEKSSRKHRRAERRLQASQTCCTSNHNGSGGTRHKAGERVDPPTQGKYKTFLARSGGHVNYHAT